MRWREFWFLMAAVLVAGAAWSAAQKKPEPVAAPPEAAGLEASLHASLRNVINRGVDIYNGGDIAGCYRLFEGSLRTVKPLLLHRPALAKRIEEDIAAAEKLPVLWERAFALRRVLDKIREEIKPEAKKPPEKKPEEKPPEKKPPEKDLPLLKMPKLLEDGPKPPDPKPTLPKTELKMPRLLEP